MVRLPRRGWHDREHQRRAGIDGLAELEFEGAQDLTAFSDETVVAYQAKYSSIVDTADYCSSSSDRATLDLPCAGFGCE